EGQGGQAEGAAVVGELVEEGVGGGVVGLAGAAQDTGRRGEEQEQVEGPAGGEAVQVGGAVGLGAQHVREAVGGQFGDGRVGQDAGAVHNAAQGCLGVDAGEEVREGVRVGHVAGGDLHAGAERGEFGGDVLGARVVCAAAGGEQQAGAAVAGEQPGDGPADPAEDDGTAARGGPPDRLAGGGDRQDHRRRAGRVRPGGGDGERDVVRQHRDGRGVGDRAGARCAPGGGGDPGSGREAVDAGAACGD